MLPISLPIYSDLAKKATNLLSTAVLLCKNTLIQYQCFTAIQAAVNGCSMLSQAAMLHSTDSQRFVLTVNQA